MKERWTTTELERAKELRRRGLSYREIGRHINQPAATVREKMLLHYPQLADIRGTKQYKPVAKVPILGNVPPARVSDAYGRLLLEVGNGEVVWHRKLFRW